MKKESVNSREDRCWESLLEQLRLLLHPVDDQHQRLDLVLSIHREQLRRLRRVHAERSLSNVIRDLVQLLSVRLSTSDELGLAKFLEDGDERLDVGCFDLGEVVEGSVEGSKEVVPESAEDLKEVAALRGREIDETNGKERKTRRQFSDRELEVKARK